MAKMKLVGMGKDFGRLRFTIRKDMRLGEFFGTMLKWMGLDDDYCYIEDHVGSILNYSDGLEEYSNMYYDVIMAYGRRNVTVSVHFKWPLGIVYSPVGKALLVNYVLKHCEFVKVRKA